MAFSASPIVITAGPTDSVVIRGVTLKALTPGSGFAIDFQAGGHLSVESCLIDSWDTGIRVTSTNSPFVQVLDTIVRNGILGIDPEVLTGTANVAVHNSRFERHSSCAVLAGINSRVSARDTVTSGGAGFGFCALNPTVQLNCQGCLATGHAQDGFSVTLGAVMRVAQSMSTNNGTGFHNNGSTFESLGNNLVEGNGTDTLGTITVIAGK